MIRDTVDLSPRPPCLNDFEGNAMGHFFVPATLSQETNSSKLPTHQRSAGQHALNAGAPPCRQRQYFRFLAGDGLILACHDGITRLGTTAPPVGAEFLRGPDGAVCFAAAGPQVSKAPPPPRIAISGAADFLFCAPVGRMSIIEIGPNDH